MTDIIDTIIDIATTRERGDARGLIAALFPAGQPLPTLVGKTPGQPIPVVELGLNLQGQFTDQAGRTANVYTAPEPQANRPLTPTEMDLIAKTRDEMNRMSKDIVDKTMGRK